MIKVLVFGKSGQLARCLAVCRSNFPEIELQFLGSEDCDLVQAGQAEAHVKQISPDVIVNAAAYTAVDMAESQQDMAFRLNSDAVREMAEVAKNLEIPLIHVSTDYVFDGQASNAYTEKDQVSPLGVYGASKLAGEVAIREIHARHLILRTSWVFSPFGKNFVKTMMSLMAQKDELRVVHDQIGCPTSALDLANAVLQLVMRVRAETFNGFGTYHVSSDDTMTWYEFASQIQKVATSVIGNDWQGQACKLVPVTTAEFPTIAKRPKFSAMSGKHFVETFGIKLPEVEASLVQVIGDLKKEKSDA